LPADYQNSNFPHEYSLPLSPAVFLSFSRFLSLALSLSRALYMLSVALSLSLALSLSDHTLVLTVTGLVWSCGKGEHGRLGHGNTTNKIILTFVEKGNMKGMDITMIVAGGLHSMALEAAGTV